MYVFFVRAAIKVLANEETFCCRHKCLPTRATSVADTKNVSDFVQKHFVSATNFSQLTQPKKHHEQQCVRNNVSSFASTFTSKARDGSMFLSILNQSAHAFSKRYFLKLHKRVKNLSTAESKRSDLENRALKHNSV